MSKAKIDSTNEVTIGILSTVLNELNPSKSEEEWEEYIKKFGNEPKAFFGSNGQGYEEYQNFISNFDKTKKEQSDAKKRKRGI